MVIQHNMSAFNSNRQLGIMTGLQAKSSEKLSSGYKINRAADDAAGLAISEKMRRQIRGLDQAAMNIQDGISLVQVADGALAESSDNLQRVNELAVKSANGTLTDSDRSYIQQEVTQLLKEIDRTATSTTFNDGIKPLLGSPIKSTYPSQFSEGPVTVMNSSGHDISFDGNTYHNGDSFVIDGVLKYNNAFIIDAISHGGEGGGMSNSTGVFNIDISDSNILIIPYHLSDLQEDPDGALYYRDAWGFKKNFGQEHLLWPFEITDRSVLLKVERVLEEGDSLYIQAGSEPEDTIPIKLVNATAENLGVDPLDVSAQDAALVSIEKVKSALLKVNGFRSDFGAMQNRLEHAYNNVTNTVVNTQDAETRIRDTDMAAEMVKNSNNNIILQAGQSMLAQVNQTNQGVLSLLQ